MKMIKSIKFIEHIKPLCIMIHIISEVFTKNIFNFFIKIRDGILLASLICLKGEDSKYNAFNVHCWF